MTIHWKTDKPSTSAVEYDHDALFDTHYGFFAHADLNLVTDHAITIDGLAPNTQYAFRPYSTDAAGNTTAMRAIELGSGLNMQLALPVFHTGQAFVLTYLLPITTTPNAITFQWFTSLPTSGSLSIFEIYPDSDYALGWTTPVETTDSFVHEVTITDLKPKTEYGVRIHILDAAGSEVYSQWCYWWTT